MAFKRFWAVKEARYRFSVLCLAYLLSIRECLVLYVLPFQSLSFCLSVSFSVRQFRSLIANCLGCVFCLPFYCHSRAGEIGCQQTTPLCQLLHSPAFVSVAVFSLSLHCCLFFIAFPIPLYSLAHAIIMQIKSFPSLYLDDLRPCLHRSDRRRRCRFSIATKCDNILTANCSAFLESAVHFSVSDVENLLQCDRSQWLAANFERQFPCKCCAHVSERTFLFLAASFFFTAEIKFISRQAKRCRLKRQRFLLPPST